jgi:hypothetical protein
MIIIILRRIKANDLINSIYINQENMKEIMKGLRLLLAFTIVLSGCKKDSNDETRSNAINYEGLEYSLSKGFLEYYGKVSDKESYNMDLTLISSGLIVYELNGEIDSVSGIGNVLYFEVFTSDSGFLDSRTYTFDPLKTYEPGTFDNGVVGLNLNVLTFEGEYFPIVSGSFKINKKGDEYEFSVNCKNGTGKTITGYFKGTLKYYNYGDVNLKRSPGTPSFFKRVF